MDNFENNTKPCFKATDSKSLVKVGGIRERDARLGINKGYFALSW